MATTDERLSSLEQQFAATMSKVDMLVTEMRDRDNQRAEEMRDRDNQRAAEIMELRQRQDAAQAKHDADVKEMNQRFYAKFDAMDAKIDRLGDKIQTLVITAIVGFGAILVAVISAMK